MGTLKGLSGGPSRKADKQELKPLSDLKMAMVASHQHCVGHFGQGWSLIKDAPEATEPFNSTSGGSRPDPGDKAREPVGREVSVLRRGWGWGWGRAWRHLEASSWGGGSLS